MTRWDSNRFGGRWDDLQIPVLASRVGALRAPTLAKWVDDGAGSEGDFFADFTLVAQ